ncbi:hypothetical protein Nepgr_008599 [Nepenthes gracilis]|uniref:WEB family protein n=1 Tax=Nepenthes gracilis TaxID=150966 RepID=A0AAD3S9M2_NEPGR|nr:hypothetical protein Nepgr_008599 [Nepenthes gracilis]
METQNTPTIDTTSPFHSVKEAVAIFGQQLAGEIHSQRPSTIAKNEIPQKNDQNPDAESILKKLVAELEATKMEIKLLKKRESETEVALASLSAQLHRNMSKMEEAEAEDAVKAAAVCLSGEERRNMVERMEGSSPISLAQVLSSVEREEGELKGMKKKKKKPIIPLVSDIFVWKKRSSSHELSGSLYSPQMYFP